MQKINNLLQLKKLCMEREVKFIVEKHYMSPEFTGQKRIIKYADNNGFYSGVLDEPDNIINSYNVGKGIYEDYGCEKDWRFSNDGLIRIFKFGNPVMDIRLTD